MYEEMVKELDSWVVASSLKIIQIKIKNYLRPCEPLFSLLKERTRLAEVALESWS